MANELFELLSEEQHAVMQRVRSFLELQQQAARGEYVPVDPPAERGPVPAPFE